MNRKLFILLTAVFGLLALNACKDSERSSATGWKYNDAAWGGFEKLDYEGQETGPNLVLVPGGSFTMGLTDEDVLYGWNNVPRQVTVSSFYIDETEVSNTNYREFMHWTKRVFGSTYPLRYKGIVPDTLVWREELAMNEPYIENYLRHPAYNDYPVVGVSWLQANEYCNWRTDRVNEMMMIEKGIINPNPDQKDSDNFNTDSYLAGQYQPVYDKPKTDLVTGEERSVSRSDGILLPSYRLPTEAEWEYAALALLGNQATTGDEVVTDRRIFGWDGYTARHKRRDKNQGNMMANFKRGAGDYMGIAGALNDNASIPAPVRSFLPNDFGLYNMSGNVAEWVADIYRPMTSSTLRDVENHDLNPYRGGRYYELITDENGAPIEKDSLGRLQYRIIADSTVADRENFKRGDVSNYLDGDDEELVSYDYGRATLISSKSRVIKGGSWADRLYWLSPGARKFKDEDQSSREIGFRCAMHRVGGPTGNEDPGGLDFGNTGKKKKKRRY